MPAFAEARSQFERDYLTRLLQITHGNVTRAAGIAKRNRTEFYKLLQRHHLNPAQFKAAHSQSMVNDPAQRESGSDVSSS
jgi:two-component system response regulator GlrR